MRPGQSRPLFLLVGLAALAGLVAVPLAAPVPASAMVVCVDFSEEVLQRVRPSTGNDLLTTWPTEAAGAARYGFTADLGTAFRASRDPEPGLVRVHRLYRGSSGDYVFTPDRDEIERLTAAGYTDQGPRFSVSAAPASCLVGVERWTRNGLHRLALVGSGDALPAAGWRNEGVRFYARPLPVERPPVRLTTEPITTTTGSTFSFAAVGDTQHEVLRSEDHRLANRSRWVLRKPKMSFLLQTGDLTNWDTPDHAQWEAAKRGLAPLQRARLPYTFAVGNHDTLSTGVYGGARDTKRSRTLLRETDTANAYFSAADFRGVGGQFEAGKIDNLYTLYRAGGLKWMVLTLEFCPRKTAVAWARRVVAAHPDYNVIISTHYYLTRTGKIGQGNEGYGETSPRYLWQQVVGRYPNVKMVFSGHVGSARKARVDTGAKGNKVYSFLTTMHDRLTNPTRYLVVDTKARTVRSRVYAPDSRRTWKAYSQTLKGVRFVR